MKILATLLIAFFMWFTSWHHEISSEPEFYSTDLRQNVQGAFIDSLNNAKKTITLSVFALNDKKVIQALRTQSENGIDVTVITDKNTQNNIIRRLGSKVHTILIEGRGLMHQKITVIDNEISWLGSANYTGESLRVHSNIMQKITSKEVAKALIDKMTPMKNSGLKKKWLHQTFSIQEKNQKQSLELWFLPDDQGASLRIKELMRSAKKTIRVAMYTFTRHDFATTLIQQANRGVDVQVILDRSMAESASKSVLDILRNSPVKLHLSEGTSLLHNKMMIIDDKILEHGSANYTKAAFTQNDDYFIVLYDLTSQQNKELDLIWQSLLNRSNSH